ncbi:MAG: FAD-binding oxidoreductase [Candidatus Caldarchaeum sp.]|nr:FAD-binding oxidoreductase [Candidatus Caldarchaeum sp.]MDW8436091.1 FAD-binding oxidoreductase [Candidatus Caldarchaeum sp.]
MRGELRMELRKVREVVQGGQRVYQYDLVITEVMDETELAKTYFFKNLSDTPIFDYHPGQDVKLYFDTPLKRGDFRFYSIAGSPTRTADGTFELMIKSEGGTFAPYFHQLAKPGEIVTIEGPYGRFLKKAFQMIEEGRLKTLVFLAASSGIVPFKCFVDYATDRKLKVDVYIFYVNRTRKDFIYRKVVPKLLDDYSKLQVVINFTREHDVSRQEIIDELFLGDDKGGRVETILGRHILFDDIRERVADWGSSYYGICGGAKFIAGDRERGIDGMMQKLEKGGVSRSMIEIDSFGTG